MLVHGDFTETTDVSSHGGSCFKACVKFNYVKRDSAW